ncbi:hypothetical protein TP46_08875 [Xanthomonas citri pv. aurantifolii]|nr:hypothetical protein TP37_19260 [Xanthomonas citri pv. aurantifolii]TBX03813.1 hypothetical protein TP46_08875 [Xanthomonas citri pv. aurantifolii]
MPNIWQTPISSTPDSKPDRYSGRGDVGRRQRRDIRRRWMTITCNNVQRPRAVPQHRSPGNPPIFSSRQKWS